MDTTKTDAQAHGRANSAAPAAGDLRDTLTCIAQLARLIVTVSDTSSARARNEAMAQAARTAAAPAKPKVQVVPEAQRRRLDAAATATALGALEATFDALCAIIPDVKEHTGVSLAGVLPDSMLDDKIGDIVQPIEESIIKVAWQTSELSCQSLDDIRIKAKILKCIASDEPEDIESALTISMCDDILAQISEPPGPDAPPPALDDREKP